MNGWIDDDGRRHFTTGGMYPRPKDMTKRAICPDCEEEMVEVYAECEDGSGWTKSWSCASERCQVTPEKEVELRGAAEKVANT